MSDRVTASADGRTRRTRRAVAVGVALLAFLIYAPTFGHGFVLDDEVAVLAPEQVTSGVSLPLLEYVDTSMRPAYRPLSFFLLSVDYALWGPEASGFHVTCVLLHALATALVGLFAFQLGGRRFAIVAGVLFAIHPVHTEAVCSIWNRSEVLATIFYVSALLAHLRVGRLASRVMVVNAFALLALLSKESAATLPAALLALDCLRPGGRATWRGFASALPAMAIWHLLRRTALAGTDPDGFGSFFVDQPLSVAVLTVGAILWRYANLVVAPLTLRADYARPTIVLQDTLTWEVLAGYSAALAVVAVVVVGLRRKNLAALGLGLFGLALAPYLHFVTSIALSMAERFVYLPSVGACLAAAWAFEWLASRTRAPLALAVAAAVSLSFAALTLDRSADWESPRILWLADTAKPSASAFCWANRGATAWGDGDYEDALSSMRRAVTLWPEHRGFRERLEAMEEALGP